MPKRRDFQDTDQSVTERVAGTLKSVAKGAKTKTKQAAKTTKRGAKRAKTSIQKRTSGVYVEPVQGGSGYRLKENTRTVSVHPSEQQAERAKKRFLKERKESQRKDSDTDSDSDSLVASLFTPAEDPIGSGPALPGGEMQPELNMQFENSEDSGFGAFPSLDTPAQEESSRQPGGFPELGMPPASQDEPRVPGPGMEEPDANYYEDIFRF